MESMAKGKYLRCSARRVRRVADMIRNNSVESALATLFSLGKTQKSAMIMDKVLKAAVANLKEKNPTEQIDTDSLKVSSIIVDAGPHIKRIKARAQGRAFRINKKMCHLTLSVTD
ncbi:50S ribosomal protein L22 [Fibrobacterota bacterium]